MARFYSRRYRRYRPRKYIRRYFKRRFRRYVNGSSRSTVRVKVPVSQVVTMAESAAGSGMTAVARIRAWNHSDDGILGLINQDLYKTYTNLYDEVAMVGMKIRLSFANSVGSSALPALKVHSCWDRRNGLPEARPSQAEIQKSSSYMPATAINNSVCRMQRSIWASDLIERAQWHDCSITKTNANPPVEYDAAYDAAGLNPNFFCPAFFFYVEEVDAPAWANVKCMIDVVYYLKFRNPRGGSSISLTKGVATADFPSRSGGDGDDMDDDDDQVVDLDAGALASMSAMADMDGVPANVDRDVAAAAAAGAITSGPVRGSQKARGQRTANQRAVFGGRGSLNV